MDPRMQAQLDAAARKQGFKDYAQWSAWQARQREMTGNPNVGAGTSQGWPSAGTPRPAPRKAAPPQNWFQQLVGALRGN